MTIYKMQLGCACLLIISCALHLANSKTKDKSIVKEIDNKKDFDAYIQSNRFVLVNFCYSSEKDYRCRALEDEFKQACIDLKSKPVKCVFVNFGDHPEVGKEYFKRIPALVFFRDGSHTEIPAAYAQAKRGKIQAQDITDWATKKSSLLISKLFSPVIAKKLTHPDKIVLVAFFKRFDDPHAENFELFALDSNDIGFYMTADEKVWKVYDVTEVSLQLFNTRTGDVFTYKGNYMVDDLRNFVNVYSLPNVLTWASDTRQIISTVKSVDFILGFFPSDKVMLDTYTKYAEEYRGELVFIHADSGFPQYCTSAFKLVKLREEEKLPAFYYIKVTPEGTVKYRANEDVIMDDLVDFISDVKEMKVKPILVSEPITKDWDKGPVLKLVGENHNSVAKDTTKHRFIEYYAPWCGHCKKLVPIWEELGEKFKDNKDVVIGALDYTANDVTGLTITGFPTLLFYPKGTTESIRYSEKRDIEQLTTFVEEKLSENKEEL